MLEKFYKERRVRIIKENKKELNFYPNIEKIIKKYEDKDYFGYKDMANMKVESWLRSGSPESVKGCEGVCNAQKIKQLVIDNEMEQTREWVKKLVDIFLSKNKAEISKYVRGTQPFTKEIFEEVSGIDSKNLRGSSLDLAVDNWCKN